MRRVSNLNLADNNFFEAYKRLDKLCSEMYTCQNGVSEYITQMERRTNIGQYRVPSWNDDYKQLKHIRWVRNKIAHDSGSLQISDAGDLDFVQDFYTRIFTGSDPLTMLRKANEAKHKNLSRQKKQQKIYVEEPTVVYTNTPNKKKSRSWIGILLALGIIALAFLILYFFR